MIGQTLGRYDNTPIQKLSAFRSVTYTEHLLLGQGTKWAVRISPESLTAALWLVDQYAQLIAATDVQKWRESDFDITNSGEEYRTALWGFKVIHAGGHVDWPAAIDDRASMGEAAFHDEFDRRLSEQVGLSWATGLDEKACYALIWLAWSTRVASQLLPPNFPVRESDKERVLEVLDLLRSVVDSGKSSALLNNQIKHFAERAD